MLIGYARVSTYEQNLDLQQDALEKAGCERVFTGTASGALIERPGLAEALKFLRKGDTLVIWKLDRLGRSLRHLIQFVQELDNRQIGLRSLQEQIDTTTPGGKLVFHVFSALAEFERDIIRQRTHAGLEAARQRGRTGGRPPVMDQQMTQVALSLREAPRHTVREICQILKISPATYYRHTRSKKEQATHTAEAAGTT